MTDKLPIRSTDKWTFHLHQEEGLQFHITSGQETGDHILIEGHDISILLDFLYDHRELIYHATHDEELHRLEATEAGAHPTDQQPEQHFEPIFYFDDGIERTRASH